jgi:hypothetical protein
MNTHGVADTMYEMQGLSKDLLPACIVSTTFPAVPAPPSLTLAAFATKGYVQDGPTLVYVDQEAHNVVITGGDGQYWLALAQDTWTTYASWNRVSGSHYLWRANATRPPDVDGVLVFIQMTVAGGAITVVSPLTNVTNQPMSKQNSNAVAITGGNVGTPGGTVGAGVAANAAYQLLVAPGKTLFQTAPLVGIGVDPVYPFDVSGAARVMGAVGIGLAPTAHQLTLLFNRGANHGLVVQPSADTGGGTSVALMNAAFTLVGSISTTASATAFNTSSDRRLKEALQPLTDALKTVEALTPLRFRWRGTGAPGVGFAAQDVQPLVPEAVTGDQAAATPMQMDLSKLVPYLVGACQELAHQVEALTVRLATLEGSA